MITSPTATSAVAPAGLASASKALDGLAALFNLIDAAAWNSLARPDPRDLANLTWSIRACLDQGIEDAGFTLPD